MQAAAATRISPVDRFFQFSLLGLLTSGYLAVAGSGFLDLPTILIAGTALLLKFTVTAGLLRIRLAPLVVTIVTLVYIGFYALDYRYISGGFVPATIHLIFFLASMELLTAATQRDYTYLKTIAFLEMLAACILSASLNFFLCLAAFVAFGVATFASGEIRRSAQRGRMVLPGLQLGFSRRLLALCSITSAAVLVLTGALFFVLPRTARAAFQQLVSQRLYVPGFSGDVDLGRTGEIVPENTPVMHVRMDVGPQRPPFSRWRGSTLSEFDGKRWFNPAPHEDAFHVKHGLVCVADDRQRSARGKRVSYEVRLKDGGSGTLFYGGIPECFWLDTSMLLRSPAGSFRIAYPAARELTVYQVSSFLSETVPNEIPGDNYRRLPLIDSRIWDLARAVSRGATSTEEQARGLEQHLRTKYGYTLQLPKTASADPLAHFLFERKEGHCEYFASAMAVMLRTLSIPSRVVIGYSAGVFNPLTGWQVVRASDAHSWVEAWLPGRGWTAFDPTPASSTVAVHSFFSRWNLYSDAAEVLWQDWVLNYSLDRQLLLASRLEQSGGRWNSSWWEGKHFGSLLDWKRAAGILTAVLLLFAILWWAVPAALRQLRRRKHVRKVLAGRAEASDATLLYSRLLAALERRGHFKPVWLTPVEFAETVRDPAIDWQVREITEAYNRVRWGLDSGSGAKMLELLGDLERA